MIGHSSLSSGLQSYRALKAEFLAKSIYQGPVLFYKSHCYYLFGHTHVPKFNCYFYSKSFTLSQNTFSNHNLKRMHFESNLFSLKTATHQQGENVDNCKCLRDFFFLSSISLPKLQGIDMKLKQTTFVFFQERFIATVYRISSWEVNCKAKCFKIICLKQSRVMYN